MENAIDSLDGIVQEANPAGSAVEGDPEMEAFLEEVAPNLFGNEYFAGAMGGAIAGISYLAQTYLLYEPLYSILGAK